MLFVESGSVGGTDVFHWDEDLNAKETSKQEEDFQVKDSLSFVLY